MSTERASVEDYIARVVAEAPPITPAQRDRLASLFASGHEAPADSEHALIERLAEGLDDV